MPQIEEGRQVRFVFLPDNQDPDSFVLEFGAAAFDSELSQGMPLSDFLVQELAGGVDMSSVDGRARLAELARPLVGLVPPGVFRELLMERLAESVGLSALKLDAILAKGGPGNANKMRTTSSKRSRKATGLSRSGKPSVLRRTITLLLHYPQAAKDLDIEALADLQRPGADLLRDIIENVQAEPNITTAGILERWRHDDHGQHLGKLATIEVPQDDEFDAAAELADCLGQLAIAASRDRIDALIEKVRVGGLNEAVNTVLGELGRKSGRAQNILD